MCGIVGLYGTGNWADWDGRQRLLCDMADAIRHRGPDDEGYWSDAQDPIDLGFRRLAILDLTEAGRQPMISGDGRYVMVFNGEIYNHRELRQDVEGVGHMPNGFRGHSDTEVLLAGFVRWGIEGTIRRAVGMFAMAIWDRELHQLTLVRDRMGEKPLYYGWIGTQLAFASELKALKQHPDFAASIDRTALAAYFRLKYIPDPYSIYEGIWKLPPGSYVQITQAELERGVLPAPRSYWDLWQVAAAGLGNPFTGTQAEADEEVAALLDDVVRNQLVADVPVGAFLSGGIDSSAVVALMREHSSTPVRTFTIGSHDKRFDEAPYAAAVARQLGTEHTELYVTGSDALKIVPRLSRIWDEPFSDSSQIPTYLVSQLAKSHVTVALSGDGGDEVFAGYNRYLDGYQAWNRLMRLPGPLRRGVGSAIDFVPPRAAIELESLGMRFGGRRGYVRGADEKARKLARILRAKDASVRGYYTGTVSDWTDPATLVPGGEEPHYPWDEDWRWRSFSDPRSAMMAFDMVGYLPGDILVKVDRASMSHSLETRAPYLDHRLIEFMWTLPIEMKIGNGEGKAILRRLLANYVPLELFDRPKTGFGVPIHEWLRSELREWAEDLLDPNSLKQEGFLDPILVRQAWDEHQSGSRDHRHRLWSVLMFQAWLREQR